MSHRVQLFLAVALGTSLLGLGCAGGKQWVSEVPDPSARDSEGTSRPLSNLEEDELWRDPRPMESRPRLSRVLTLGQIDLPSPEKNTGAASVAGAPPVVVTVNNYVTQPAYSLGYGYAPYYYAGNGAHHDHDHDHHDRRPRRGGAATPLPSPPVGGDWPAVPDSGPQFPLQAMPAKR